MAGFRIAAAAALASALTLFSPLIAQAPPQMVVPNPVKASALKIRVELAGRMPLVPTNKVPANPTAPIVAGKDLLLIDISGRIYRWTGTASEELFGPTKAPANIGLRLICGECLLNAAANAAGDKLYVAFISSSLPKNIPQRRSPREPDSWYVIVEFALGPAGLTNARPVTAFENRSEGHLGGGLVVLDDGSVLTVMADNGDSYEDGRTHPQDLKVALGKIHRVNVADGSSTIVASGVRGPQRLVLSGNGADTRLTFVDPGGWVAEELNSVLLSNLLGTAPLNFGWGRAPDGKAREGMIYIDAGGSSVSRILSAEPGFVAPIAEVGRGLQGAFAVSGPVISPKSFQRITALFGELVSGELYAVTGPLSVAGQDVFRVGLVDAAGQPTTVVQLAPGGRPDPRFFTFPDGTAGMLIERTGEFFRLTEITDR